ncbi:hypothetical protein [Pseudoalteromonas sp. MMG024]|uniref:hypothetical protein n=1 Tax=Pseudoalteromonas sp. MMG024 TaxID=2909980 RepID=UPI001F31C388|nr:hypothetical protein [Pseudoalteromonas sp. MMG024]MCF6458432.1 hypothetical protein [Pseudoalteromonas sp. MMG024]
MINLLRYNLILICMCCGFSLSAKSLQDPTRPKTLEASSVVANSTQADNALVLQSVFVKDSGNLAVVAGQMVRIGDQVQGYKVIKITSDSVTLEQGQTNKVLRLYQHEIKK